MTKRISLILPTLALTHKLAKELEYAGITESHIHVFGKHLDKIENAHLHSANVLQTTDIVPAAKRGLLLGVILSVGIFCLFYFSLPAGVSLSFLPILCMLIFGLLFGAWASAMIGIGIPSKVIESAQPEIQAGHYLMMVDVPVAREYELLLKIQKNYPQGHIAKALLSDVIKDKNKKNKP